MVLTFRSDCLPLGENITTNSDSLRENASRAVLAERRGQRNREGTDKFSATEDVWKPQ